MTDFLGLYVPSKSVPSPFPLGERLRFLKRKTEGNRNRRILRPGWRKRVRHSRITDLTESGSSFESDRDFHIAIATMIANGVCYGKLRDRFSLQNRSAISRSKSDPDFQIKIDPRLKTTSKRDLTGGAHNRDPFFVQKPDPDFQIKIDPRFSFYNRDPNFVFDSRSRSRLKP